MVKLNQIKKYNNQQLVTPQILKFDEQAIQTLNSKFRDQQLANKVKGNEAIERHEQQRQSFKMRHLQNYLYEKQLAFSQKLPFTATTWREPEVVVNEKELEKMNDPEYFPCRYSKSQTIIDKTIKRSASQSEGYLKKLAKHREPFFPQALMSQHSDYKGLFIGELDLRKASQTNNCFIKKILPSQVVQQALQEQQQSLANTWRPKTGLTDLNLKTKSLYYKFNNLVIPTKNLDDFNQEHKKEEKKKILKEIEQFDKISKECRKGTSLTQTAFLDPQSSDPYDGIKRIQEQRMMRQMIAAEIGKMQSQSVKK